MKLLFAAPLSGLPPDPTALGCGTVLSSILPRSTNISLFEVDSTSPIRHSKNFRVLVVGKIDDGISRLIQIAGNRARDG